MQESEGVFKYMYTFNRRYVSVTYSRKAFIEHGHQESIKPQQYVGHILPMLINLVIHLNLDFGTYPLKM
jgi:hypothetical protein